MKCDGMKCRGLGGFKMGLDEEAMRWAVLVGRSSKTALANAGGHVYG